MPYCIHPANSVSGIKRGFVWIVGAAFMFFSALPALSQEQRHVALDGQSNFRDIGGYETTDGRIVRWGEIYRSGELPRLTDADIAVLDGLGLSTVVNFLTSAEIEDRGPDRLPKGVYEISAPITGGDGGDEELTVVVTEARRTGDFSKVPVELNEQLHQLLITEDEAKQQYARFLRSAMDPDQRPLVFHCSHGVHRTGTAAALLLSALGVPWETVREDYLLSNTYRADEIERRISELRALAAENQGIPESDVDTTNLEAFYRLQGSYIDASLSAMLAGYDSVEGFLLNGLGLTEQELETLRAELLQ